MANKKTKRKLNLYKVLIFILFLCAIVYGIYYLLNVKIENVIIEGSSYYSDSEILSEIDYEVYPKLYKINKRRIKKELLDLDLIKSVKVKLDSLKSLRIIIEDNKILYQRKSDGLYLLENGNEFSSNDIKNVALLVNYYPNTLNEKALSSFSKLSKEVLSKISMIEYSPTKADEERFLLYMFDGNLVYINLNRMDKLNKYTEIINEVGTKKGILNLDSGNYFEVKK